MSDDVQRRWAGSMPEAYDRWLWSTVFRPFAVDLARRVSARRPGRVLELAPGTGVLTRELVAGVDPGTVTAGLPEDPPTFIVAIPHGYADVDLVLADVRAGGFGRASAETVTLEGRAASAADIAVGFCTGTPLRAEIEARADLGEVTAIVAEETESRLGAGEVRGRMTAHVIEATVR